jgi:lactoylglutathione lyase
MMKRFVTLTVMASILLAVTFLALAAEPAKNAADGKETKKPSLRRPGFVFLEFLTEDVDGYISYFESVTDFKITHKQPGYASLESDCGQVMFMDPKFLPDGHPNKAPFKTGRQGTGLEIGLVVADLDKAFAAATKFPRWKVSSAIAKRPWGVRDFRILAPDGYYLRFTEGR